MRACGVTARHIRSLPVLVPVTPSPAAFLPRGRLQGRPPGAAAALRWGAGVSARARTLSAAAAARPARSCPAGRRRGPAASAPPPARPRRCLAAEPQRPSPAAARRGPRPRGEEGTAARSGAPAAKTSACTGASEQCQVGARGNIWPTKTLASGAFASGSSQGHRHDLRRKWSLLLLGD